MPSVRNPSMASCAPGKMKMLSSRKVVNRSAIRLTKWHFALIGACR